MTTPNPSPLRVRRAPRAVSVRVPEIGVGITSPYVQGTLALDLAGDMSPAPAPPAPPTLTVLAGGSTPRFGPDARGLPDPRDWAARFCQAIVEVIGGDRPAAQLVRWTSCDVYRDLNRRVRILGLTSNAATRGQVSRPQVRSVRVCQPAVNIAEVAVHLQHGCRSRALAARLEIIERRWLCTALQIG
jgi:Family of unknown function (DUF6459)